MQSNPPADSETFRMAKKKTFDHGRHFAERLAKLGNQTPYLLRISEWKNTPIPVLIAKERHYRDEDPRSAEGERRRARAVLIDRGSLYGEALHRCLPVLRQMLESVTDQAGIPLELDRYMSPEGLRIRGNLPLDEETGAKLALLFRLQDRLKDLDRVDDRPPGRALHPRRSRLLAVPYHQLRPRREPLGAVGPSDHAGRSPA